MKRYLAGIAAATVAVGLAVSAQAQEVTVGYQLVFNPWKVPIVEGTFEKETGAKINFRKFDSGAKVITAMASGDAGRQSPLAPGRHVSIMGTGIGSLKGSNGNPVGGGSRRATNPELPPQL